MSGDEALQVARDVIGEAYCDLANRMLKGIIHQKDFCLSSYARDRVRFCAAYFLKQPPVLVIQLPPLSIKTSERGPYPLFRSVSLVDYRNELSSMRLAFRA